MSLRFTIKDWSAFASGLTSRDHWLAWAQAPRLPVGNDASAITQMPVLLRRRLERLGRIAGMGNRYLRRRLHPGAIAPVSARQGYRI